MVQVLVHLDVDRHPDVLLEVLDEVALVGGEGPRDLGVDAEEEGVPLARGGALEDLAPDLEEDRRDALDAARARAVGAGHRERPLEALPLPLAGDLDEPELGDGEHPVLRPVLLQLGLEGRDELLPVLLLLHVDEVDDEEAAQVAQADLPHDLLDGLHVRAAGRCPRAASSRCTCPC